MVPLVCALQWYFSPRISFRFSFTFWLHFSYYIVCTCDRGIHFYLKCTIYNKICKLGVNNVSFQAETSIIGFSTKAITRNFFDSVFYPLPPLSSLASPPFPSFRPLSAPFHLAAKRPPFSPSGVWEQCNLSGVPGSSPVENAFLVYLEPR